MILLILGDQGGNTEEQGEEPVGGVQFSRSSFRPLRDFSLQERLAPPSGANGQAKTPF
jgi:hypothetical protein